MNQLFGPIHTEELLQYLPGLHFRGAPVSDLTREELILAVIYLSVNHYQGRQSSRDVTQELVGQ